jgi:hypothetical protein
MPPDATNIEYQLGQLTGQVAALVAQMAAMQVTMSGLDARLRENERDTTKLMVKMGTLATVAGGIGSLILNIIERKLS